MTTKSEPGEQAIPEQTHEDVVMGESESDYHEAEENPEGLPVEDSLVKSEKEEDEDISDLTARPKILRATTTGSNELSKNDIQCRKKCTCGAHQSTSQSLDEFGVGNGLSTPMNGVPLKGEHASTEPGISQEELVDRSMNRTRAKVEEFEQKYAEEKKAASTVSSQRGIADPIQPLPPPPPPKPHGGHRKSPAKIEYRSPGLFEKAASGAASLMGYTTPEDRERKKWQQAFEKKFTGEYQRRIQEQQGFAFYWESECRVRQGTINTQSQMINQLEVDRNIMRKRIEELEKSLAGQESLVLDAQSKALQMLDKAEWTPQEDSKTRQQLNGLEKLIRNWCKAYAIESFPDWRLRALSEKELAALRREWSAFSMLPEKGTPIPQGFEEKSMHSKAWMLLAAWLTDYVYYKMFERPFFFFEDFMIYVEHELGRQRKVSANADIDMKHLLAKLKDCYGQDSKDVQHFRSQFLRLLSPPSLDGMPDSLRDMQMTTASAKQRFATNQMERFLKKCSPFLKAGDMTECERLLTVIMTTAADLSSQLWTQRSYLVREDVLGEPFRKDSKIWAASGLHTAELSDNENALEDLPILMVFHPTVIAYGDSEGITYSTKRILKKAVVWMHDQNE